MMKKMLNKVIALLLFLIPIAMFGQSAPTMGTAAGFAIFSSAGAVTSSSTLKYNTHITGNTGSAPASTSGFGNVDGVEYQGGTQFNTATVDVQSAYDQLNAMITNKPALASPFGLGNTFTKGIYRITGASQLSGNLILDGLGDPNAVFIFQLQGGFSTATNAKVKLVGGALACNVFWKVEGAVTMAANTSLKGTIIAHNALIDMMAGDTLEGRALALNGAISVNDVVIYTPIGCNSPKLNGPIAPTFASADCYGVFTSSGPVTDDAASFVVGDVGTNGPGDLTTGYVALQVKGNIHPIADGSTAQCAADLGVAYSYVNGLPQDILLLEPTLFGHNLVLTPHTYRINGAVTFTDSLYLNAEGNSNAVFIIKVYGAFASSTNSNVILMNGAQAKNVYWMINGAVSIGKTSIFNGSFVSAGAIDLLLGSKLNGRAFTTVGQIKTYATDVKIPTGRASDAGSISGSSFVCKGQTGVVYSVSSIGGATTYSWNLPSGASIASGTKSDTSSIKVDFSSSFSGGNITVQGLAACANGVASANFTIGISPAATAAITTDKSPFICNGNNIVLSANAISGATYLWKESGTANTLGVQSSAINVTVTPTQNTTYTVSITNSCGSATTTQVVSITPAPTANITGNNTICNSNTVLSANLVAGGTYTWTESGLDNTLGVQSAAINVTVTPTQTTTYTVSITNSCGSATTSMVVNTGVPPAVFITGNGSICNGNSAVLTANTISNSTYLWTESGTANTLGVQSTATEVTVTPAQSTTYTVSISNSCGSGTASFVVSPGTSPTASITGNTTICKGSNTVLAAANVNGANYLWSESGLDNTLGTQSAVMNVTVTPTQTTTYTVSVSNSCGTGTTTQVVIVNQLPLANAGSDKIVCAGVSVSIGSSGNAGDTYNWAPITGLSDATSQPVANPTSTATYILTETNTASGCTKMDTVIVTVNQLPLANAGSNQSLINGKSVDLGAAAVAGNKYKWTQGMSLSADTIAQPTANPTATTTYTLTETNSSTGCSNSNSIVVTVTSEIAIEFFNGFSPNGDGQNDFWRIPVLDFYPENSVKIINRWGGEVWRGSNYNNTTTVWTGKNMNGDELPDGVYYYIISYNDVVKEGWVVVKR